MGLHLTGRTRHRAQRRLFGEPLLVLQVEYAGWECEYLGGQVGTTDRHGWRDATFADLSGRSGSCASPDANLKPGMDPS